MRRFVIFLSGSIIVVGLCNLISKENKVSSTSLETEKLHSNAADPESVYAQYMASLPAVYTEPSTEITQNIGIEHNIAHVRHKIHQLKASDSLSNSTVGPVWFDDLEAFLAKFTLLNIWVELGDIFGAHLLWIFIIFGCAICSWTYLRYIQHKPPRDSCYEQINVADEINCAASPFLIPGEELLFFEEQPVQTWRDVLFRGRCNQVWKFGITNLRLIAQKRDDTCFGAGQWSSREDAWPRESISRISIVSGEFWGRSVSVLRKIAFKYLCAVLVLDLTEWWLRSRVKQISGSLSETNSNEVEFSLLAIMWAVSMLSDILLVLFALYSVAILSLLLWPFTIVKVYLKIPSDDEDDPVTTSIWACCGRYKSNSSVETFTFRTERAYEAYAAIVLARFEQSEEPTFAEMITWPSGKSAARSARPYMQSVHSAAIQQARGRTGQPSYRSRAEEEAKIRAEEAMRLALVEERVAEAKKKAQEAARRLEQTEEARRDRRASTDSRGATRQGGVETVAQDGMAEIDDVTSTLV